MSFYGVYLYNHGQVQLYPYDKANGNNSVEVLEKIRAQFPTLDIPVLWDGVSYHRCRLVRQAAERLDIELEPLPAYSPDFMPIEHLWQWLHEEVTYHFCYDTREKLIAQLDVVYVLS